MRAASIRTCEALETVGQRVANPAGEQAHDARERRRVAFTHREITAVEELVTRKSGHGWSSSNCDASTLACALLSTWV